jgi:hypothetical protein
MSSAAIMICAAQRKALRLASRDRDRSSGATLLANVKPDLGPLATARTGPNFARPCGGQRACRWDHCDC